MQNPTSGNYILRLQMAVRFQHERITEIQSTYNELISYLLSSKFHNDPTVQVADVLRRIQPIQSSVLDAFSDRDVNNLTKPVIATGEITSL